MIDDRIMAVFSSAKGFMPEDEGLALYTAAIDTAVDGPLLEIGTYCGKSALLLGAAARERDTVLFTVDHHRGSEENQAGWEHHDPEVVDPSTGRMDTLPFFRRNVERAGLEAFVVGVVGDSLAVARAWATPVSFCFIDGGHAEDVAMSDYEAWTGHIRTGGTLAIHDVFEDPAQGGQAPLRLWLRAVEEGFEPRSTTGSLRVLSRSR